MGPHLPGNRQGPPAAVEDPSCICDRWTPQNAVHLYLCPWVGDEIGRSREQASKDEEWCTAVARFVQ